MTGAERHRQMEVARVRAELTVQDLWLRYLALGGSGDAFDLDGYLQGLVPLETFQQDVLAQALNEALEERYRAYCLPLSNPTVGATDDAFLSRLAEGLLDGRSPAPCTEPEAPDAPDA
jgi:hypothetical protein